MTWNELKIFCNTLSEAQLGKNVVLWREDEGINDISAECISEDHYIGDDDSDGCYPESDATEPIENLTKVYSKGDAILFECF